MLSFISGFFYKIKKRMDKFKEKVGIDFTEFYHKNKNFLLGFILKKKPPQNIDVDGLINDAFAIFHHKIDLWKPEKVKATTYLYAIAKNLLYREIKKSKKINIVDITYGLYGFEETAYSLSQNIFNDEYSYELDKWYKSFRQDIYDSGDDVMILWLEGNTGDEISERLEITISQVKQHIYEFKKIIRRKTGKKPLF